MGPVTTPTDPLRLRVRIDSHADAVFKALTDPDLMAEWLAESAEVSLDDTQYEFWGRYTPLGDRPRQQLLASRPLLSFSWDLDGAEPSQVRCAIEEQAEGATVVTVAHSGIPDSYRMALDCFWYVTLANLGAHCEGLPTMPPFDFSAPAHEAALARTVIDVPVEEVYAALLDPALVNRWIGGEAVIEPQVGGVYDFSWEHGTDSGPASILELQPDKLIAYSWRVGGRPDTVVKWQLRGVRGSTYLTLVHDGFADDAAAEEYRLGWPPYLVELKRILELGEAWEPMKF